MSKQHLQDEEELAVWRDRQTAPNFPTELSPRGNSPICVVDDRDQRIVWKPAIQEWLILACLTTTILIVSLDVTILGPVLPLIAESLKGNTSDALWVVTSFLLASSACQLFIARLSDVFGRRPLLLISLSLFTLGSLICCLAQNFKTLIAGRFVQGIGGGGSLSLAFVISSDIIPLQHRPRFQILFQVAQAIGFISGPLIGGLFAERAAWRWCFYINFPPCFVALALCIFFVRINIDRPPSSFMEKVGSIDWIGSLSFILSTGTILLGLLWAGVQYPWCSFLPDFFSSNDLLQSDAAKLAYVFMIQFLNVPLSLCSFWFVQVIAPITLGTSAFAATIAWEAFGAKNPFISLQVFNSRARCTTLCCGFLQGLILCAYVYQIPFFFQACKAASSIRSGVDMVPAMLFITAAAVVVNLTCEMTGRYRWALRGGHCLALIGSGLGLLWDENIPTWKWALIMSITGAGQGAILASLLISIQAASETNEQDQTLAIAVFSFSFGQCLGIVLSGTVFQNAIKHQIEVAGLSNEVALNAQAFIYILQQFSPASLRDEYIAAYSRAFGDVWITILCLSSLALFISLFIQGHTMTKALKLRHVIQR